MPNRVLEPRRVEVIDDAMAAMFRAMTPAQRVASALRAHRMAREFIIAIVRSSHPDWADELVSREVARRMSGGAV